MKSNRRTSFRGRWKAKSMLQRFLPVFTPTTASRHVLMGSPGDSGVIPQLARTNATADTAVTTLSSTPTANASPTPGIGAEAAPPPVTDPEATQPVDMRASTPWECALNELRPEDRADIDFQKNSKVDLLGEFIREVEKSKKECEEKRWGYYESNGEKVFYADILLTQLNKYVIIGDISIQANPHVAGLAWAGFRLLLQVGTADIKNMRLVFNSLEYLVRVLSRCDIYEKLYARRELQAAKLLDTSLVNLYVSILQYLCCARQELSHRTPTRILNSVFSDLGQFFKKIQECEKDVWNDADTAEKESAEIGGLAREERTKALEEVLFEIKEPILNIERLAQSMYECLGGEKRIKILMWLSGVPFQDHHSYFRMRRHNDTGHWLAQNEKFRSWRSSISSSILWLRGDAGAGKTMLASKVIDELQPEEGTTGHALAYFYCNYREEERRDPASMLRALVKQLCLTAPGGALPKSVLSIYQEREDMGHASGPLSLDESKDLIINLSAGSSQTTIVIDALDECNRNTRRDLFRILRQILTSTTRTRIFVTSRNDGDIRDMFVGLPSHCINTTDNTKDIDIYINSEIGSCFDEGLLPKDGNYMALKTDIISTLSKGAHGMFMWAHFQILAICEEHTPGNIRKALARLPKDLNETYDRIIQKINDQSPDNVRTANKVLKWLLYVNELSSPGMINEFLSVKPGEATLDSDRWTQHQILDICQNLVVYDTGLNVLRFAHFSVQEFLLRQTGFSQQEEARTNIVVAEVCLTVLTYHHSGTQGCQAPALLKYAVSNWVNKVKFSGGGSSTLEDLWQNFLKHSSAHYKAWASVATLNQDLRSIPGEVISPLWVACYYQLYDIFRFLLHSGADPNCCNYHEETPLHYAARHGLDSFVRLLIGQQDVDVNCRNSSGRRALSLAAERGHGGVVQIILEDARVDPGSVKTALFWAARREHGEVVQMLLEDARVDPGSVQRALILTAGKGYRGVVQILLEDARADLESVQTALFSAVCGGHGEVVQILLEDARANPGSVQAALFSAACGGHGEVVRILLEDTRADPETVERALLLAASKGHGEVVQMLMGDNRADQESVQKALLWAGKNGHKEMAQMIIEKGGTDSRGGRSQLT